MIWFFMAALLCEVADGIPGTLEIFQQCSHFIQSARQP